MAAKSPWFRGLQGSSGWEDMQNLLQAEKAFGATWQNLLAVHTSTCCAPGKEERLVPSLEDAGLKNPDIDKQTGQMSVSLIVDKLFPELTFGVESSWHYDHVSAKEEVCKDTLTFALILAPHLVRMHPNSVKHGEESITQLRELGASLQCLDNDLAEWQNKLKLLPPAPQLFSCKKLQTSPTTGATASASGTRTTKDSEAEAEALIFAHYEPSQDDWVNPSHLKKPVYSGLAALLPKGSLRRFLQARPDHFEVRDTGVGKNWEFKRKK